MDDTDDIEVEVVEPEEIEEDETSESVRKGIGIVPVIVLSVLAALFGTLGGAYGAQYITKAPDLLTVDSQIALKTAELKEYHQKALNKLNEDISALKNDLMQVQGGQASEEVLAVLQNRVETLESRPLPEFPEIDKDVVTALQKAQADGFDWPDMSGIETRLDKLEIDFSDVSNRLIRVSDSVEGLNNQALLDMPTVKSDVPFSIETNVSLPAFPETALREAAALAVSKKGFFARTLTKHIDVRHPSDPIVLIEKASAAVKSGDLELARKTLDALPDDIKSVGQDWRDAASKF